MRLLGICVGLLFCCLITKSKADDHIDFIMDRIYVGDQYAAANLYELQHTYNISAILNVAWDLDLRYSLENYTGSIEDDNEHLNLQYSKVGLVDGTGNIPAMLISAMITLHQFLTPRNLESKDQNTYPQPVQNVLVHCHSGHSRSVTVAALYLYYTQPDIFRNYEEALLFVKSKRGVLTDPNVPEPPLNLLAHQVASTFHSTNCSQLFQFI